MEEMLPLIGNWMYYHNKYDGQNTHNGMNDSFNGSLNPSESLTVLFYLAEFQVGKVTVILLWPRRVERAFSINSNLVVFSDSIWESVVRMRSKVHVRAVIFVVGLSFVLAKVAGWNLLLKHGNSRSVRSERRRTS